METINELMLNGQKFLESGNFDDALGYFEQALLLDQNDPESMEF